MMASKLLEESDLFSEGSFLIRVSKEPCAVCIRHGLFTSWHCEVYKGLSNPMQAHG